MALLRPSGLPALWPHKECYLIVRSFIPRYAPFKEYVLKESNTGRKGWTACVSGVEPSIRGPLQNHVPIVLTKYMVLFCTPFLHVCRQVLQGSMYVHARWMHIPRCAPLKG